MMEKLCTKYFLYVFYKTMMIIMQDENKSFEDYDEGHDTVVLPSLGPEPQGGPYIFPQP